MTLSPPFSPQPNKEGSLNEIESDSASALKPAPPAGNNDFKTRMAPPGESSLPHSNPSAAYGKGVSLPPLRNIRAEIQDLQAVLDQVRKGIVTPAAAAPYIKKTSSDIEILFRQVTGDNAEFGDTVRHIRNYWEQMVVLPLFQSPEQDFSVERLVHSLDTFDTLNRKMVFYIAMLTVPERIDEWLVNSDPGYYIPFHVVFEDEVPNIEDRTRLLNLLACTPNVLKYGKIESSSGLVYRITLKARDWGLNLAGIVLTLAIASGLVAGAAFLPFPNWPLNPGYLGVLLASFAAVFVGIFVHILIDKTKTRQDAGSLPPVFAISDLKRVLSAQVGSILVKIGLALIGLFGLIFVGGITQLNIFNAFLMGYSLDSFIGLFATSAEERSSAQLTAMKEKLQIK